MKLIIDIDEEVRVAITRMGLLRIPDTMQKKVDKAIQRGIPLDKIGAEIEDVAFDWQEIDGEHESFMVVDLNDALRIIDKYIGEGSDKK